MPKTSKTVQVEGREIALSNLEKIFYTAANFSKAQIIQYYADISSYLLPHLKDRPVTLKRYPDGVDGKFFYEKDAPSFTPKWVKRFSVPRRERGGRVHYIVIDDLPTLIWAANIASVELHPFLHRVPEIGRPTSMVFDFDPGPGADVLTCAHVALLVRELLREMNLQSFSKVSGSKGLQLYVPLNGDVTYEMIGPFARAVAERMAQREPRLVVSKMAKEIRAKKVFIDWSQNSDFKTTISVYSLRAKAAGPYVSAPVSWDELISAVRSKTASELYFAPEQAIDRAKRMGDLFQEVLTLRQTLPTAALESHDSSKLARPAW